jgi:peptidoglycan/LPS O-acetylase OafA/YrhL
VRRTDADAGGERTTFRSDVEGLRAVAVTLVVLYHAGVGGVGGGYVGVDVFFVLSGFVITLTLASEFASRGTFSIASFYARRAIRLLPAATAVILVTLVGAWLWLPPIFMRGIAVDALASTFYGINYRLALVGVDYFATDAPSPLQHYWSLAVEEQFYFVWPLLLLATALLGRRVMRQRHWTAWTALVLVLVIAASFASCVWLTGRSLPLAYFAAPTRAWELALGALVAVGASALARVPSRAAAPATWMGLAAVVVSALWFDDATAFPGYAAALPVAGTALAIAGGCATPRGGADVLLRAAPLQRIGRLSYSWYLWHWPVFVIAPAVLGVEPNLWQRLLLAAGSLGLAWLCYTFLENPIRTARNLRRAPWNGIRVGASLSVGTAAVAVLAALLVPPPVGGGTAEDLAADVARHSEASAQRSAALAAAAIERQLVQAIAAGVTALAVPSNLTPALQDADRDWPFMYNDGCDPGYYLVEAASPCLYGDVASQTTVVLYGDSHAGHWFPALNVIATQRHWRLVVLTKGSCSAASTSIALPQLKRAYTECDEWRTRSVAKIRDMHPAMVVLSSYDGGTLTAPGDPDQLWTNGWLTVIRALKADGTRLALISDTPQPKNNPAQCVSAHLTDVRTCNTSVQTALRTPKRRQMIADAAAGEGVTVVDPTVWFCTATTCPDIVGNLLVYSNGTHISTAYSALLAPLLERKLA